MLKEKDSKLKNEVLTSLKQYTELLNANSIVGTPILTDDSTIIPIVKILVASIGGGGEYGEIKMFSKDKSHPFAGGNGSIANITPSGFLVCKNGSVSFVKVDDNFNEFIFNKTSDLISKAVVNNNEK